MGQCFGWRSLTRWVLCLSIALALVGCSSVPSIKPCEEGRSKSNLGACVANRVDKGAGASPIADRAVWEAQWLAGFSAEPWARECLGMDTASRCQRPTYGVALAGGGSKAAPFAMGAIKRLVEDEMWPAVDVLSSVSGGGYAAYYAYQKAHEQSQASIVLGRRPLRFSDWFVDARAEFRDCDSRGKCVPPEFVTVDLQRGFGRSGWSCGSYPALASSYQKWVACYQDIFGTTYGGDYWRAPDFPWGSYAGAIAGTIASLPFHHAANTLFDWGLELSPSQAMYTAGISRAYGMTPSLGGEISPVTLEAASRSYRLTYADLRRLYERKPSPDLSRMPYWVLQATNASSSTWFDVRNAPYELDEAVFELGAYGFGSGSYGYVVGFAPDVLESSLDVPRSVLASAAFLDPVQKAIEWNRGLVFLGLHAANLKWGIRVPNYNVPNGSRALRAALPFPLYYAHSFRADRDNPYIRLADGGQSGDNLGVYSQLQRGVRHIISIDGAFDADKHARSYLPELCTIDSYLRRHHDVRLVFRGTPEDASNDSYEFNVGQHCTSPRRQNEVGLVDCPAEQSPNCRPSPYFWKRRVWVGTVRPVEVGSGRAPSPLGRMLSDPAHPTRIYYVKAALDYERVMALADEYFRSGEKCVGFAAKDGDMPCGLLHYMGGTEKTVSSPRYKGKRHFPQGQTVELTADSNRQAYYAYLQLGWYATGGLCKEPELKDESLCKRGVQVAREPE